MKKLTLVSKILTSKGYTNAKNRYGVTITYDQGKYDLTIKIKIISYTELKFFKFPLMPFTITYQFQDKDSDELSRLKPGDNGVLGALSPHHWAALLSLYNTTLLSGGYVTLLPPVHLASTVSPDRALTQRNPLERQNNFQWHSLAVALDPIDFNGINPFGPFFKIIYSNILDL